MIEESTSFSYQVGGSLAPQSISYVERQADRELQQALQKGQFCYVLNSRQMGKSSLRVRVMQELKAEAICLFIDLTGMGTQDLTSEKWYAGIVNALVSSSQIKFNWRHWWREKRDLLTPVQRLGLFIEEVLLVEISQKVIIFIDEIDRVLSQNFVLDDFFALIHSCYQKRQTNAAYSRLTFALLGVAAPRDLIADKTQSPFDIGRAIDLQGFKLEEVSPLIKGLSEGVPHPERVMAEILFWTGGQPFLTQKLCQLVREKYREVENTNEIVEQYVIDDWEVKDEPEHLKTIRDRIYYRNSKITIRLLALYREILHNKVVKIERSREQIELRLSGLVVAKEGKLTVNNPLYARVFNLAWIDNCLSQLRPYESALKKWAIERNSAYLLTGKELQNTLTWSLGKSLANIDYQFLVASQELAQQETENTLAMVKEANVLLAETRKKAAIKVDRQRLDKKWLITLALAITGFVLLLRFTGLLQIWEWNFLDLFFRWQLSERQETRILVVTIDEKDISQVGQWPISDRTLATAIDNLKIHQPSAIALDLHRNLTVPPGQQELAKIFSTTHNLYVVEKVVGEAIAPPTTISRERVGFSDIVLDKDRTIRRALLSVVGKDGQTKYSLGTKLALHYLQEKNITLQPINNNRYRLGKAVFQRFNGNNGGYVNADVGGYQILLNFWGTEANFPQYSLTEVLNNDFDPQAIRDRLILIGSTGESIKDFFYLPYSNNWFRYPQKIPGVFVHANVTSQIISAAIDNRPLLNTYNKVLEFIWILLWGIVSVIIFLYWRNIYAIAFVLLVSISCLLLICYLAFLAGWWLPFIPSLLTLVVTTVVLIIIRNRQKEQLKFNCILRSLLTKSRDRPIVSRIALEYFKQSENKHNQILIDKAIE